jgi:hypothetical protein
MSNETFYIKFQEVLESKLTQKESQWLASKIERMENDASGNQFVMTYSLIFRFITNEAVDFSEEELALLNERYPSFSKSEWTKHSLCRALLMSKLPQESSKNLLLKLMGTCSVKELVDFYKNLFFLDNAEELTSLMEEGIRTNVTDVFDAIARYNPYGAKYLSEGAWNQLVLKAIFMGRPLYKIFNLYERKNEKLAYMLNDYIHERWSAGREVSPEVWQLMMGFQQHPDIKDTLQKASFSTNDVEQEAAQFVLENTDNNPDFWLSIGRPEMNINRT